MKDRIETLKEYLKRLGDVAYDRDAEDDVKKQQQSQKQK